jgi:hypothetical protein
MVTERQTYIDTRLLAPTRLLIGAVQGLTLYLLYSAGDARVWPATNPHLFLPLAMIAVFVPLLVSQGLSVMRLKTLLIWAACAVAMLAIFGAYNRYRTWLPDIFERQSSTGISNANQPNEGVLIFSAAALFITQALVTAGDTARSWIAPYARYFETATKQAVQLALSLAFTGAFWLVLFLGAQLFKLIGLTFFQTMIEHAWFAIPATALAMALAVHISDIRASIVEGIRSIALTLLSWLLPLLAVLAAGFLIALLFTGLEPLWKTRNAASILLLTSAALVILSNAAFQDGDAMRAVPLPMRLASMFVGFILLPFTAIAAYAIYLRVAQYGWTGDRISAAAVTLVALTLAIGYFGAAVLAVRKSEWRFLVERTNIGAAFLSVAVIFALFSPIADPTRIAVNSQVAMLESGAKPPTRFDFNWLRWEGGRAGHVALVRLATSQNADIKKRAADALASKTRVRGFVPESSPAEILARLTVRPAGYRLPPSLLQQTWDISTVYAPPPCLMYTGSFCEVFPVELTGDNSDELIFIWGPDNNWSGVVVGQKDGGWTVLGALEGFRCIDALKALRAGQYHPVAPAPSPLMSLDVAETRLDVRPVRGPQNCPAK